MSPSDKTAIIWQNEQISFNELLRRVSIYYRLLLQTSARPTKVMIFSENRPEYIYALYAGFKAGASVVPADYLSTEEELAYMINDCTPNVIFASKGCAGKAKAALKSFKGKRPPSLLVFEQIKTSAKTAEIEPVVAGDIEQTALVIYTSGTTGSPKGVMLSFKNLFCNMDAVIQVGIYSEKECVLVLLPIHHVLPLLGSVVAPLLVNGTVAIAPSMAPDDIIAAISSGKVSVIIGVPRLYEALAAGIEKKINERFLSRLMLKLASKINSAAFSKKIFKQVHDKFGGELKFLVSGGAALDPKVGRLFSTLGFYMLEGYGMTEAAPMIAFPRPNNIRLATVGQPLPGIKIKIAKGEILVKGDNIMQGYYGRWEETAEALKGGWLHTGDLGEIDKDGFLTITGRKKDIIVLPNGKNINPEEIEAKLLAASKDIAEAAVFMADGKLKAVMRFASNAAKVNAEEQREAAYEIVLAYNNSASPHKRLMSYSITNIELPRTRMGKIKRFALAALSETEADKKTKEPAYKEYAILRDFLENETGQRVNPNDHFELDLGMDSLSKVGLLVFLEKTFGLQLKDTQLKAYPNLLKLSALVKAKKTKLQTNFANWTDILKEKVQVKLPKSWFTTELFQYTGKGLFKVLFNLKSRGKQNIPKPPFILAPNHQSMFDPLFVAAFLKRRLLKDTFFYAKAKYFENRFLKFVARINNIVLVDINNDLKGSIQVLAEILKAGKSIIIFPEGTRTRNGLMGEFKQTFAILSRELNVPIVPVAISGAYNVLPPGRLIPKPFRQVEVDFLAPITPDRKTYSDIANAVKKAISAKLDALNKKTEAKAKKTK